MSRNRSAFPWGSRRSDGPRRKRPRIRPEFLRLEPRWLLSGTNGITEYPTTATTSQPTQAIAGADGNLWVTEYAAKELVAFTATGAVAKTIAVSGSPYGITSAPDGTLWFTENGTDAVCRQGLDERHRLDRVCPPCGLDSRGDHRGARRQHLVRRIRDEHGGQDHAGRRDHDLCTERGSRPVRITTGSDGNLWVTESAGDRIARITTGGSITEFAVPTASGNPWGITAGPDGNLWFTEDGSGKIGRITTAGVITEYSLAGAAASGPSVSSPGPTATSGSPSARRTSWAGSRPGGRSRNTHCRRVTRTPMGSPWARGTTRSGGPRPPSARSARCPGWPGPGHHHRPDTDPVQRLRHRTDRRSTATSRRRSPSTPATPVTAVRTPAPALDVGPLADLQLRHGRRPADHPDHLLQRSQRPGADPDPGHAHVERRAAQPPVTFSSQRATARAMSTCSTSRSRAR